MQNATKFKKKLLAVALAVICLTAPVTSSKICSTACGADSVTFSHAQAESLLALIDSKTQHIAGLEIDLWEARQLARADSVAAAERARIMQEYYDSLLSQQPSWLDRTMKHPVVWLALGMYLGVQASTN